ncbi:MAG: NAD(P)/FAD-dependent oxidoreductase [Arcobacteraceae bacterium]
MFQIRKRTILIYDVIIIGSGAAGLMAAISSKKHKQKVLILEQLDEIAIKLKATGGGRCNLTNTLSLEPFMEKFGKNGRFMRDALIAFSSSDLQEFMSDIGVQTHAPDGFRIFPTTHKSTTIIEAIKCKLLLDGIEVQCSQKALEITKKENIFCIKTTSDIFYSHNLVIATGGSGYKNLGATGEGYEFVKSFGHSLKKLYPAMMPLLVKDDWVSKCTADTIAKATIQVDIKKYNKLKATGDLIFSKNGIRGPVVLDFAREITPLFDTFDEIPVIVNMIKEKTENDLIELFKVTPTETISNVLLQILPKSIIQELLKISKICENSTYKSISGEEKINLLRILTKTPMTINGSDGFKLAMITRGGINLKEINPASMESKIISNLYFAGEIVDIDGPCGGYNLQWAFSSGFLAGSLK